jgi:hypothetical protein
MKGGRYSLKMIAERHLYSPHVCLEVVKLSAKFIQSAMKVLGDSNVAIVCWHNNYIIDDREERMVAIAKNVVRRNVFVKSEAEAPDEAEANQDWTLASKNSVVNS